MSTAVKDCFPTTLITEGGVASTNTAIALEREIIPSLSVASAVKI